MPEISLLQPRILLGVVQSFLTDVSPSLRGLTLLGPGRGDLNPTWEYDMIRGARDRSTPNAPNAEAHRRDHLIYRKLTGSYIYLRDKKTFNPTTLRWLREPGNTAVTRGAAERAVMMELLDLENAQKRYMEYVTWAMFTGAYTYTHTGGGTTAVDYLIQASHKPTASPVWAAAGDDPIGNIQAWKQLITRDAGATPTTVYLNNTTMTKFIKLPEVISQLSDRQKQVYTTEGMVPRFMGLDWIEYDGGYVESSTYYPFIADDKLIIVAPENNPWEMRFGPSADHEAPPGTTGAFSKSWLEPDPSNRQVLLEKNFMPILTRPDHVVYASVA